jgi:hypothetical protein
MAENKNNPGEIFIAIDRVFTSVTSVDNTGSTIAYPTFTLSGNGTLYWIKNFTNGQQIYFNNLRIGEKETVTIKMSNTGISITSNVKGNISQYIYGGISSVITLAQGINDISVMYFGVASNDNPYPVLLNLLGASANNTDAGTLYVSVAGTAGSHTWSFYKDSGKTLLVAETDATDTAYTSTVYEKNSSGLSGFIQLNSSFASLSASYTWNIGIASINWNNQFSSVNGIGQ